MICLIQIILKPTWKSNILNGSSFNKALHDGAFVGSVTASDVVEDVASSETEDCF